MAPTTIYHLDLRLVMAMLLATTPPTCPYIRPGGWVLQVAQTTKTKDYSTNNMWLIYRPSGWLFLWPPKTLQVVVGW